MNLFFKFAPLFYLVLLLFLNMKLFISNNILYTFLALSMLIVILYLLKNPKIYIKKYFIVFLIINLTNLLYLTFFHQTMDSFMYTFAKFTLFSLIVISVYKNRDFYIEVFPKFLTYIIFTILVASFLVYTPGGSRYGGLLGNPNSFGIVSALLFGLVFLKDKFSSLDKIMLFFAIVGVLLSSSRNALLGIGIAYVLKGNRSFKNILTVIAGVLILAVIYTYMQNVLGIATAINRINPEANVDLSTELRMMELTYGLQTVMLSPWIGNGLDKYAYIDSSLIPEYLSYMVPNPHNSFLALLIQYGIPMGTFILLLLLTQIYKVYRWKGKNKIFFFIMFYFFIAATFESFLFGVNGFETMIFWIAYAINMLIYSTRKEHSAIKGRQV